MKFSAVAVISAAAGLVSATPFGPTFSTSYFPGFPSGGSYPGFPSGGSYPGGAPSSYTPPVTCLTNDTAATLVKGFASLLTNYSNATADALLANDFTDTSDSINQLAGYPEGSVTFPSKAAFKAGQGSQPAIGFTVLSIDTVTCTNATFRWAAQVGQKLFPVKGINSFVASNLNSTTQGWQIKTMYSEFNSLGWLINLGGKCSLS